MKRADPGEQLEIVRDQLAEPDPRIDDDPLTRDPGRGACGDSCLEILQHLDERRIIDRLALHRQGFAAHMHQHDRRRAARDESEALGIVGQCRDVVDDARASRERSFP